MTTKRTVLWCVIFALLLLPLVMRQFRRENPMPERPNVVHVDEFVAIHQGKVKDSVDLLRKQTLDETFAYLSDDQQYFYPGFHPPAKGVPREMEELLSARSFLKVFQQFGKLPREQALAKLPLFCEMAIEEFEALLECICEINSGTFDPDTSRNPGRAKSMLCASVLLAARLGDSKLLLHQIDKMQSLVDSYVERDEIFDREDFSRTAVLEDDCLFTVLMYALKQGNTDLEMDIPDAITQKIIPLYRWDADATHYDLLPQRGMQTTDPQDVVEQITVYAFPIGFDDQQKKLIIESLKEHLSK